MADAYRRIPGVLRRIAEEDAAPEGPVHDDTHGRYMSLVALIDGTPADEAPDSVPYAWIAAAMRAAEPPHSP